MPQDMSDVLFVKNRRLSILSTPSIYLAAELNASRNEHEYRQKKTTRSPSHNKTKTKLQQEGHNWYPVENLSKTN